MAAPSFMFLDLDMSKELHCSFVLSASYVVQIVYFRLLATKK